jgi:hypothetical protein
MDKTGEKPVVWLSFLAANRFFHSPTILKIVDHPKPRNSKVSALIHEYHAVCVAALYHVLKPGILNLASSRRTLRGVVATPEDVVVIRGLIVKSDVFDIFLFGVDIAGPAVTFFRTSNSMPTASVPAPISVEGLNNFRPVVTSESAMRSCLISFEDSSDSGCIIV